MPALPVKERRQSELHLPEISRDDIVRTLSEIRMPDLGRPKIDVPEGISKLDWPKVDLGSIDVGKAVAGVAAAAHIGRKARRPRWPMALGALIVAGLIAWAVLANDSIRTRLSEQLNALRDRLPMPARDDDDATGVDNFEAIAADGTSVVESATFDATNEPEGITTDRDNGKSSLETAGSVVEATSASNRLGGSTGR